MLLPFVVGALLAADPDTTKVAAISMNSVMGDYKTNLDRIEQWTMKARAAGATFAVFPELAVNGSLCNSKLSKDAARKLAAEAYAAAVPRLEALAREQKMTLVVGIESVDGDMLRNAAVVVDPRGRLATYRKLRLPNRNEEAWFKPGRELPVVASQGWKFSVGICADIDKSDYFTAAAAKGAEFMLCPIGGSGYRELVGPDGDQTKQAEKHRGLHLEKFLVPGARDSRLYLFYANQAGKSGDNWFPGLALVVDPRGELIGDHYPKEGMLVTTVSRKARAAAGPAKAPPDVVKNSAGETVTVVEINGPEKKQ